LLNLDFTAPEIHEYDAKADSKLIPWNKGIPHTEAQKQKLREAARNKDLSYITDEYREKLRKSQKEYHANASSEQRARFSKLVSVRHKGRKASAETCAKISAALKGRKLSAEGIAKRTKALTKIHYGKSRKQWSEELGVTKETISAHLKKGEEHFLAYVKNKKKLQKGVDK
jgi:hypothetical protein